MSSTDDDPFSTPHVFKLGNPKLVLLVQSVTAESKSGRVVLKDEEGNDLQFDDNHQAQSVARPVEGCLIRLFSVLELSVHLGKGELFNVMIDEGPIHPSISLFAGLALTLFQLYAIPKKVCRSHPLRATPTH